MSKAQQTAVHHTEIDIWEEIDDRIAQLGDEISEVGIKFDVFKLFMLEACGYTVDLQTGMVIREGI